MLPPPVWFQDTTLPAETLVTAPRSSQTATAAAGDVTVLTAEDLARTGERSLPRMIERAARIGVWNQETNMGGGAPILRGFQGEKVLIVVDGVRLNDATTRLGPNQSLNTIDPAIVERVEILRGTGSVQYGSDAIGGTILIWTKRRMPGGRDAQGTQNGLDAGADVVYQSVNQGYRISPRASWSTESDGFLVNGSYAEWNELRSGDGQIDNTGYQTGSLFGSWVHALGKSRSLRLTSSWNRDFDVPRTDRLNVGFGQTAPANAEFLFERQDQRSLLLSYSDEERGGFADRFQTRLFVRDYEEQRRIRNTGSSQRRFEVDDGLAYGLGLDWRKALNEEHVLTWGVDLEQDEVDSSRTNVNVTTGASTAGVPSFAPNSRYASAGVFVQDEIAALDPVDVTVGLRYSYFDFGFEEFTSGPLGGNDVSGNFDALTASLGLGYDLSATWRATAALTQGFRAPHLDDLARNSSIFGGTEMANPDLQPEEALSASLGVEHAGGPWRGAIVGFYTNLKDAIGRRLVDQGDPTTLGDETYLRANVGEVDVWGAEASVERKLGDETADVSLALGVAWTAGEQRDGTLDPATGTATYDGVPAKRIPPLNGFAALAYEPPSPRWSWLGWAELRLTVAAEQDELNPDDLSDPRIDPEGTAGWERVDLDFGGPIAGRAGSTWMVGFHNVLDELYRVHGSGLDAPGFGVVVGLGWTF